MEETKTEEILNSVEEETTENEQTDVFSFPLQDIIYGKASIDLDFLTEKLIMKKRHGRRFLKL